MAQSITPTQVKYGYECYYRCNECYKNVYENYQWINFVGLVDKSEQDDAHCPYCKAEIDFNLTNIDKPSDIIVPILRFPTKKYAYVFKTDQSTLTTVNISVKGNIGESFEVNWGDKKKIIVALTGSTQVITHNYTGVGQYPIQIFCKNNILNLLYINSAKLMGKLPVLSTQTGLQYTQFVNNLISGSLPPFVSMSNLIYCYVYNNQLTGSIPALTDLINIKRLYFYNNGLTGSIPSLNTNVKLEYLYLRSNSLSGSIPALTSLSKLVNLYLNSNQLTGSIPSLSNCVKLRYVYIMFNNLSGTIPSLSNCVLLKRMYFNDNQITGYTASTLPLCLTYFRGNNNLLTSTAVNQILADFVTNLASRPASGQIRLHGTGNLAPTGQGIIDKQSIIAHGWTVLTN